MKMYTDLTVEGTPEEIAAFKHIDAALASRTHRAAMKAIEAPKKPAAKKVASKRLRPGPRGPRAANRDLHEQMLKLIAAKQGITSAEIAEYMKIPHKRTYNYLYGMTRRGEVIRDDDGRYHRVPHRANVA